MTQALSVDHNQTAASNTSSEAESPALNPVDALEKELADLNANAANLNALSFEDEKAALKQIEAQADAERANQVRDAFGEAQPLATDEKLPDLTQAPVEGEENQPEAEVQPTGEPTDQPAEVIDPAQEPSTDDPTKPPQYRIRARSDVGGRFLELLKSNPDMTEANAYAQANDEFGINLETPGQPESEIEEVAELAPEPENLDELQQKLDDIVKSQEDLYEAYENDDAKAMNADIAQAREDLHQAEASNQRLSDQLSAKATSDQFAEESQIYDDAEQKAIAAYPDAANPDSALAKEMKRIETELQSLGDDRFNNPNKPLLIVNAAATNLKMVPAAPAEQTPVNTPQNLPTTPQGNPPPARRQAAPPTMYPASGNARGSTANTPATIDQQIDSINSVEGLEAFRKENGIETEF